MPFVDFVLWVFMAVFLIGLVFVFEATLSSVFGFFLLLGSCAYFASYFWSSESIVFAVMFAVFALLSVRFLFGQMGKSRWR